MKEKILMIVFVLVLGSVLTASLAAVHTWTAPIIEKNEIKRLRISVLEALDISYAEDNIDEIFSKHISAKQVNGKEFYVSEAGDIAFGFSGSGLWGPVSGIMAVQSDLKTIKGLTIIHQEETPGLGGRISEKEFLDGFKSKEITPELFIVSPGKANKSNEIDGITGATLTCKAFERILNSQTKEYLPLIGGE